MISSSSRRVLFLARNPLLARQFSQGNPSNWTDDIRAGPDGSPPGIPIPTASTAADGLPGMSENHYRRRGREEDEMERAKERTKDAANTVIDLAKEGTVKAIESGLELGEIAKKTMDVAWDAAKDTANSFKDAIRGDDHGHDRRSRGSGGIGNNRNRIKI